MVHKEKQVNTNLTLTSIKKFLEYKLQSIYPKQNQKQITHEINKLCIFQTNIKDSRSGIKNNKNNFVIVTGDKFAMSIRIYVKISNWD